MVNATGDFSRRPANSTGERRTRDSSEEAVLVRTRDGYQALSHRDRLGESGLSDREEEAGAFAENLAMGEGG